MSDCPSPKKTKDTALEICNAGEVVFRPKGIITNALWNSSYVVWTMFISLVLTPVMIRYLGIMEYGILLLVWSVTGIMGTLNFGLGEATLRYIARYHGEHNIEGMNRAFGTTLSVFLILCIIILTPIFTGSALIVRWLNIPLDQHQLVASLLKLSVLTIFVSTIMSLFGAIILGLQRYDINIKINLIGSVFRTVGYITLVISGFGILYIVIWDLLVVLGIFFFTIMAARRLLPKLILFPSFSFLGLREILGYSTFSFLTLLFHKWHRESGKLLMARFLGPVPVVYLTTPDNIAQRFHEVVAGGIEVTLPRFSAEQNANSTELLFWNTTWAGFSFSVVLLVPFFILIPDFLSLWISPDFATQSALIGQLLALYLVFQGGFTAPAAYFRGIGKPWFVTMVIFFSLLITALVSLILIPAYGPAGAAYAYLAGSAAPFFGTIFGAIYAFHWSSIPKIFRAIVLPLISGGLAGTTGLFIRSHFGDLSWVGLVAHGLLLVLISMVFVFGVDWMSGSSNNPSKQILGRLIQSKFESIFDRRG